MTDEPYSIRLYPNGSYIGKIRDLRAFEMYMRKVKAEAWAEGQHSGWCEGYSHGEPEPNPYRD